MKKSAREEKTGVSNEREAFTYLTVQKSHGPHEGGRTAAAKRVEKEMTVRQKTSDHVEPGKTREVRSASLSRRQGGEGSSNSSSLCERNKVRNSSANPA